MVRINEYFFRFESQRTHITERQSEHDSDYNMVMEETHMEKRPYC